MYSHDQTNDIQCPRAASSTGTYLKHKTREKSQSTINTTLQAETSATSIKKQSGSYMKVIRSFPALYEQGRLICIRSNCKRKRGRREVDGVEGGGKTDITNGEHRCRRQIGRRQSLSPERGGDAPLSDGLQPSVPRSNPTAPRRRRFVKRQPSIFQPDSGGGGVTTILYPALRVFNQTPTTLLPSRGRGGTIRCNIDCHSAASGTRGVFSNTGTCLS